MDSRGTCFTGSDLLSSTRRSTSQASSPSSPGQKWYCLRTFAVSPARLRGLLPHRHVARALARERLTVPVGPPFTQGQAGGASHEVELGRPRVPERRREGLEPSVDDPVVMGDRDLLGEIDVLLEAEVRRRHRERPEPLPAREPPERRNDALDHEATAGAE